MAMQKSAVLSVIGLTASLILAMLSGWSRCFNVISVDLKSTLNLTQTKVEFLATAASAGRIAMLPSAVVIDACGFKICYLIAAGLMALSGIFLHLTIRFVDFFTNWTSLVGIILCMSNTSCYLAVQCCAAAASKRYGPQHRGKTIGAHVACSSFGKIFYAFSYSRLDSIGLFFLLLPVPFTITAIACIFLHIASTDDSPDGETDKLVNKYRIPESPETHSDNLRKCISRREVFFSGFFQSVALSTCLLQGVNVAFMNNATDIAISAGVENYHLVVYVLSIGYIVSQFIFGLLMDWSGSAIGGMYISCVCYVSCLVAMTVGVFWFNSISVFLIAAIVSLGSFSVVVMAIAILTSSYGEKHFSFIVGYLGISAAVFTTVVQMTVGFAYDKTQESQTIRTQGCRDCFYWPFVVLLSLAILSSIVQTLNVYYFRKTRR